MNPASLTPGEILLLWVGALFLAFLGRRFTRYGGLIHVLCGIFLVLHVLALRFVLWFLKCVAIGVIGAFVYRALKGESLLRSIQEPPRPVHQMGPAPTLKKFDWEKN